MTSARADSPTLPVWVRVCRYEELEPDCGASALLRGHRVAVFRAASGQVYAVDNRDPYSGTQTIARGIVGERSGEPFVAAPTGKQVFDLATGQAVEDPSTRLQIYPVRVTGGQVEVCVRVRA